MSINAPTMPAGEPEPTGKEVETMESPFRSSLRALLRHRSALIGGGIILFFIIMALIAPLLLPFGYNQIDANARLQAPSGEHWFGTDDFGRDIFARVVYGARISLWVGFFAITGSIVIRSSPGPSIFCWPFPVSCWRSRLWPCWDPACRTPCTPSPSSTFPPLVA